MARDPDFDVRQTRLTSVCSVDSLDERHRHVRIQVGVKQSKLDTFSVEHPVWMTVSGEWTPEQVWREYTSVGRAGEVVRMGEQTPDTQLFFAASDESFENPVVIPFFKKRFYDWENWNTSQLGMRDDDRIVFVLIHSSAG
jgi:hypothetical protein